MSTTEATDSIRLSALLAQPLGDYDAAQAARLMAGARQNMPVQVVPGDTAPRQAGESYYWTTPGGTLIRHPNAYRWPTVYHASTRRVEVGADWIARLARVRGGAFRRDTRHGVTTAVLCGSRRLIHGWTADAGRTHDGSRVWVVQAPDGRAYHAPRSAGMFGERGALDADARKAVRRAVAGLTRQRRADRQWVAGLGRPLAAIWVDEAASVAAGNCAAGTAAQAERVRRSLGPVGAVRADVLLGMRSDDFTRRAIAAAAARELPTRAAT